MPTEHIMQLLISERDRIQSAIEALGGTATTAKKRGRPAKNANLPAWVQPTTKKPRKKRIFTAAQRKAQGLRMKKFWAEKRKAEKA